MSEWSTWFTDSCECPKSKHPGKKYRARQISVFPEFGGKECVDKDGKPMPSGSFSEDQVMKCGKADQEMACPKEARALGSWSDWSDCDQQDSCKNDHLGTKTRKRLCYEPRMCSEHKLQETKKCRAPCKWTNQSKS